MDWVAITLIVAFILSFTIAAYYDIKPTNELRSFQSELEGGLDGGSNQYQL